MRIERGGHAADHADGATEVDQILRHLEGHIADQMLDLAKHTFDINIGQLTDAAIIGVSKQYSRGLDDRRRSAPGKITPRLSIAITNRSGSLVATATVLRAAPPSRAALAGQPCRNR